MRLCAPFWKLHDWQSWVVTRRVQMMCQYLVHGVPLGEPAPDGVRMWQERECRRCGYRQTRATDA